MGYARSTRTVEDEDFDNEAEEQSEVRCINVSPFTARISIGTVAGSKPRRHRLEPGQGVYLQHGYTVEFVGSGGQPVRPTIESLTEREAWPGVRDYDKDNKIVWLTRPGPRLPMVVAEPRAREVKAQWEAAMKRHDEVQAGPLRLTLQRQDGVDVEVQADITPAPKRARPAPVVDDEDQVGGPIDEPPPDHDDPIDPEPGEGEVFIELPVPPPTGDVVPTRAAARSRTRPER